MIEGVRPVTGVEVVSLSSLASGQGLMRRQRRLRWLAALRAANGVSAEPEDDGADEKALADMRERIAAALSSIEQISGPPEEPPPAPGTPANATITAAELARRIGRSGEASLRIQARLGIAAVRRLVGIGDASGG